MPDLATHLLVPYFLNRGLKLKLFLIMLWGAVLPDLLSRVPGFFTDMGIRWFFFAFHTPFATFFMCYGLSQLFHQKIRRQAFLAMALGALIHYMLDLLQFTEANFNILLFPFSMRTVNIGVIWPEDSLYFLPPGLAALAVMLLYDRLIKRKAIIS
ncbi:MAG: hypothetical protein RDV48_30205 [Candidatus Eremiobacteraeota bacterium]|nr:hypothetical protein [Candidatus Eremiobacteraeota bacterium]